MEFIITVLCLLVFVLIVSVFELRFKVDRLSKKVETIIDVFKIKSKMEEMEQRISMLGGGAPNPPKPPKPDDD